MEDFRPKRYFTENGTIGEPALTNNSKNQSEKIKLIFYVQNSGEGCYSVQAKLYEEQALDFFSEIKESYVKETLIFDKFFVCDFIFEKQQNIEIILKKNEKEIKFKTTLAAIVGSRKCTTVYKYAGDESLVIKAEKLGKIQDSLDVKFVFKETDPNGKYFVENKIYYFITCNNQKIYRSSLISNNGTFESIYIPNCLLQPKYTVTFYNKNHQRIFQFEKTTDQVKAGVKSQFKLNNYIVLVDNSEIIKNFSFVDYLKAGVQIALSIGIDFTASHGDPFVYGTLHSIRGNKLNDYEKAILSCGSIVGFYDYDQLFPVFGFGAIINASNDKRSSMCFNLNLTNDPNIKTIDNILKEYRNCLIKRKLTFSGPTKFAPLLKTVISRIDKYNIYEYHILMILTDGVINDLQETIDILVEASVLPLSVIIIGIGRANFKEMNILDGDDVPLVSSKGKIRARDLVQFVPFSKFKNEGKKLAMEVLAEIPRQIVEYYRLKNLNPIQIKEQVKKLSGLEIFNVEYFSESKIKVLKNTICETKENPSQPQLKENSQKQKLNTTKEATNEYHQTQLKENSQKQKLNTTKEATNEYHQPQKRENSQNQNLNSSKGVINGYLQPQKKENSQNQNLNSTKEVINGYLQPQKQMNNNYDIQNRKSNNPNNQKIISNNYNEKNHQSNNVNNQIPKKSNVNNQIPQNNNVNNQIQNHIDTHKQTHHGYHVNNQIQNNNNAKQHIHHAPHANNQVPNNNNVNNVINKNYNVNSQMQNTKNSNKINVQNNNANNQIQKNTNINRPISKSDKDRNQNQKNNNVIKPIYQSEKKPIQDNSNAKKLKPHDNNINLQKQINTNANNKNYPDHRANNQIHQNNNINNQIHQNNNINNQIPNINNPNIKKYPNKINEIQISNNVNNQIQNNNNASLYNNNHSENAPVITLKGKKGNISPKNIKPNQINYGLNSHPNVNKTKRSDKKEPNPNYAMINYNNNYNNNYNYNIMQNSDLNNNNKNNNNGINIMNNANVINNYHIHNNNTNNNSGAFEQIQTGFDNLLDNLPTYQTLYKPLK